MAWENLALEVAAEFGALRSEREYEALLSFELKRIRHNAYMCEYIKDRRKDPGYRKQYAEGENRSKRQRYATDPEYRAAVNAQAKAWQRANREKINARAREKRLERRARAA